MKKISVFLVLCLFFNLMGGFYAEAAPGYTFDFEDFVGSNNGSEIPNGWRVQNVAVGDTGVFSVSTERGTSANMYGENSSNFQFYAPSLSGLSSTFSIEISMKMLDYNVERALAMRYSAETMRHILQFRADGAILLFGVAVGQYELDKWYDVKLTYNPGTREYSGIVYDGENIYTRSGVYGHTVQQLTAVYLTYMNVANGKTEMIIDDVRMYADDRSADFYLDHSFPAPYRGNVAPDTDIKLLFNSPISESSLVKGTITLNGKIVSEEEISLFDSKTCIISPSEVLEEKTEYTLALSGVEDTAGNSLNTNITFTTSENFLFGNVQYSTKQIEEGTVEVSRWAKSNNGQMKDVAMASVLYNSQNGKVEDIYVNHASVTPDMQTYNMNLEVPSDGEYYIESYLWDTFGDANIIKPKSVLGTPSSAGEKENLEASCIAEIDLDTAMVEIYGYAPQKNATLWVLKDGKTPEDLSGVTNANINDVAGYVRQISADENGGYNTKYLAEGASGESFGIFINFQDGEEPLWIPDAFVYYSRAELEQIMSNLNSQTADYDEIIRTQAGILGLDLTDYNTLDDEAANIAAHLSNMRPYTTIAAFSEAFNAAVGVQMLGNSKTSDEVLGLLEKYVDVLGVTEEKTYVVYNSSSRVKSAVNTRIANKNGYSSMDDFIAHFNEQVILSGIEQAINQSDVKSILTQNQEFLNINTKDFNSLKNQVPVLSALGGKYWETKGRLANEFDKQVKLRKDAENLPNTGNNTGGGRPSTIVLPPVSTPTPSPEPTPKVPEPIYNDLGGVSWAVEAIEFLSENEVVSGRGQGVFDPNNLVTREEFVKMLIAAFADLQEQEQISYSDAAEDMWYYPYLAAAKHAEIAMGKNDGTFGVGESITREDMAVMAVRAAEYAGLSLAAGGGEAFGDEHEISDYAKDAVGKMQAAKIISGRGGNLFAPKDFATRAEAAKIIYELLQRMLNIAIYDI